MNIFWTILYVKPRQLNRIIMCTSRYMFQSLMKATMYKRIQEIYMYILENSHTEAMELFPYAFRGYCH